MWETKWKKIFGRNFFVELNEDIKEKHFLMSGNEEINIPKRFQEKNFFFK